MANLTWYGYNTGGQYLYLRVYYTANSPTITIDDVVMACSYRQESWVFNGTITVNGTSIGSSFSFPTSSFSEKSTSSSYTKTINIGTSTDVAFTVNGTFVYTGSGSSAASQTISSSTQTVTVHTHSYTSAVTTQPTCATTGVRTYTCSSCGGSYTETISATGNHTYSDGVCTVCGIIQCIQKRYRCYIDNGSSFVKYNTCIEDGSSWNKNFITIEVPRS